MPRKKRHVMLDLYAFEQFLDVLLNAFDAAVEGEGVTVAFEEGGGFGGVEAVFGALAGAVGDGRFAAGEFFGELGGALPVHVAVYEVVELPGDGVVADGEGEGVGDVFHVGDLAALVGIDRAAFLGGLYEVVPLRAREVGVEAIDGRRAPTAGVHAVVEMVGLEVRLDGGLVSAVDGVGPGGVGLIELPVLEDVVIDGDGGDEDELADAGEARGFEEAQGAQDVAVEVGAGALFAGVPIDSGVDDGIDAGDQARQRLGVVLFAGAKVIDVGFDVRPAAGGADEGADVVSGAVQRLGGVAADE